MDKGIEIVFWGKCIACICVILVLGPISSAAAEFHESDLTADAAILIEASTGKVLYEKNADARENPASTTKMVTLLLALEGTRLNAPVDIRPDAGEVDGSVIHLAGGDQIRMQELLQGMMLASGNDAAVAVADYMGSSRGAFVDKMNAFAARVGAHDTHFVNPNGLTAVDHYTTARDLSKIAAYGWKNSEFRQIVGVKKQEIDWIRPAEKNFTFENTNELLGSYFGANGIKTGYTEAAGECLVAAAQRDGLQLIAVVLHAGDNRRFAEAAELLDYGFACAKMESAYSKDELVAHVRVHDGKSYKISARPQRDIYYPVVAGDKARYSVRKEMNAYVTAPVQAGDQVGSLAILYDGKVVDKVPMLADEAAEPGFNLLAFLGKLYDAIFSGFHAA